MNNELTKLIMYILPLIIVSAVGFRVLKNNKSMLELILRILADFGLIREDFKHHKRIEEREKEDGIKRPFQKYILEPSSIMIIFVLIVGSISTFLFFNYQRKFIFTKNTKKEIFKMTNRMENWKENLGKYPTELKIVLQDKIGKRTLEIKNTNYDCRKWERIFNHFC